MIIFHSVFAKKAFPVDASQMMNQVWLELLRLDTSATERGQK
jgi:hypothetical protein